MFARSGCSSMKRMARAMSSGSSATGFSTLAAAIILSNISLEVEPGAMVPTLTPVPASSMRSDWVKASSPCLSPP